MSERTRVLRVIARLNIGGPAIQAISLTRTMQDCGYDTTLVRGREGPDEGSMDDLAARLGVRPLYLPALRRDPGAHDLRALLRLTWIVARERPHVVHTHAAKAGALGRLAGMLAPGRRRRVLVHTFHGHSLSGYFSSRRGRLFRAIERFLARHTDQLIAVSEEVRDELAAMGVAPPERFEVIRLGFDLSPFAVEEPERLRRRAKLRQELGIAPDALLVTLVARLVPIKRVDRFLRIALRLAEERREDAQTREALHFLIVGDGELRERLHSSVEARALGGRVTWAGFRRDMPDVCFASDVVVLSSDNEGTPVSLIEALAAGTPVVSTDVGGVASVVRHGQTGSLVAVDDEQAFAAAIAMLLDDFALRRRLGAEGQAYTSARYSLDQLADRLDGLYKRLLRLQRK